MKSILQTSTLVLLIFLLSSCAQDDGSSFENETISKINIDLSGEITQGAIGSLVIDETNPLNKYCRIDSINVYGYGMNFVLPDSLKNNELKITLSGIWRESESITGNIAISLHDTKDSIVFFQIIDAVNTIKAPNMWVEFKDSLIIPVAQNTINSKNLKIFSGKAKGKGFLDVDNLKVTIKANN